MVVPNKDATKFSTPSDRFKLSVPNIQKPVLQTQQVAHSLQMQYVDVQTNLTLDYTFSRPS